MYLYTYEYIFSSVHCIQLEKKFNRDFKVCFVLYEMYVAGNSYYFKCYLIIDASYSLVCIVFSARALKKKCSEPYN